MTTDSAMTNKSAQALPLPAKGYAIYWCPKTPGFGVRVTAAGARAWISERRVDGKTVRRTLGKVSGRSLITAAAARALRVDVSSELQRGIDRVEVERTKRKAEKVDALSFGDALRAYVKGKRRAKDGKPLKARTINDYLAMLEPATASKQCGELHALANKSLRKITADDIRRLHASLESRGERRQTYAMQVLRAVLRHEGVVIEGNPLSPTTAGAQRVVLAPSRGNPRPIPPESLGAWWRAACGIDSASADMLRLMLLTGCRPGEAAGIVIGDVDLRGGRVTLRDTKNRSDHVILLSRQAAAIVERHTGRKAKAASLFDVVDPGKTLDTICDDAEIDRIAPHKLRHTFASIADDVVTAATSRAMLNHAAGDVTEQHYIGLSESKLRAGWQAVADHIERAA
jgi:integrase